MANAAITVDLNARIAQFETDLKRATGTLDTFGKKGNAAISTFKSFGAGLAASLSVGAIASFAKAGIDAADSLNDMSQRLGVSVKDLASFKLAAEQSGTSLESVGDGIARLSRSIGDAEGGNKKLAATLKELGVTARDPKEAFFQLADAVQKIEDPAKRASLLSDVLGKSYGELVPLLNQGSAALRESAKQSETFAEAMARLAPEADKFNDNLALLKSNAAGAAASILSDLVPALNALFERMSLLKQLAGAGGIANSLGLSGTAKSDLPKIQRDISGIVSTIERLRKNSGGRDSSIGPLEDQLKKLKAQRDILINSEVGRIQGVAPRASTVKLGSTDFSRPASTGRTRTAARTARVEDPFAPISSLLASTDIGKMKEFDKQVALLNRRFDFGKKDADLYAQAMTKLVETTFSERFSESADAIKESEKALADWKKEVADAQKGMIDLVEPTAQLVRQLTELDKFDGVIDPEILAAARLEINAQIDAIGKVPEKAEELNEFAKSAAQNMQSAFADFLFDPFDKGMDGMLKGFGQTIQRMIAEAASAQIAKALFGDLSGGEGGGIAGDALKFVGSFFANGGIAAYGKPVDIPRFAGGGISNSAAIFGEAGPEAAVPLPDGRNIPVKMMGGRGSTIVVNVNGGNNAPDVRRAAGQGAREALGLMRGAQRYA